MEGTEKCGPIDALKPYGGITQKNLEVCGLFYFLYSLSSNSWIIEYTFCGVEASNTFSRKSGS